MKYTAKKHTVQFSYNNGIKFRTLAIICLCLNNIFVLVNPDAFLGIADYYIFIFGFIFNIVLSNTRIKKSEETVFLMCLIGYLFLGFIVAALHGIVSSGYMLSYFVYLVFAVLFINMDCTKDEMRMLLNSYIIAAVILAIWMFVQRYDYYGGGNERHTIKFFFNSPFDPNHLAAFMVFPALIAFSKVIYRFSLVNLMSFLIITGGLLFTSSRGAMISEAIGIGIILLGIFQDNKKIKGIVIIVLVITFSYYILGEFIPNNSLIRLFNIKGYNDRSNAKRLRDWKIGVEAFKKHPFIGYGIQGELSISYIALGIRQISHSTYIAFLLQLGILGSLLPLTGLIRMIRKSWRNKTILGCLVANILVTIFISGEVGLFFWLPLIYIINLNKMDYEILSLF